MMLDVFRCRHINTACFVGIDLIFSTKTYSAGYSDQSEAICIIYRSLNSRAINGIIQS